MTVSGWQHSVSTYPAVTMTVRVARCSQYLPSSDHDCVRVATFSQYIPSSWSIVRGSCGAAWESLLSAEEKLELADAAGNQTETAYQTLSTAHQSFIFLQILWPETATWSVNKVDMSQYCC